jgi:CheY-like chemotaxis protein/two-component sensor histidine kinase
MEAVGRLAGGVAHDYNNMLTVIIGYAEMALEHITQDGPLHNFLEEIYNAANRSMDLTRQLLAFARRQAIAPKVLNINEVVANMLKMLQRLIGEGIKIEWLPGDKVWPIKIDPTQIDQIMANLCVNSRDAIGGVGNIRIQTENVELDDSYCAQHCGFKPGKFVQLTVSDDGIGIDSEIIEKIFEPFFSTKAIGRGTGLGLATVYGIVKQNGGYVNVYSEPGKGTIFKIYLPQVDKDAVVTEEHKITATQKGNGETILLVEDDPAILRLANKMLHKLNYQVIAVNSPIEALSVVEEHQNTINLLLTDVVMPELNGNDLAKKILSICPNIKVLFMSGYAVDTIFEQGVLEENFLFIEKPFSSSKLSEKLSDLLQQSIPHDKPA